MAYSYVYKLYTPDIDKWYIGSRQSRQLPENDILVRYFTSSKVVKLLLNQGLNFVVEETILFDSYEEAVAAENQMLRSIIDKSQYLNINFSAGGQIIKSKTHTFITSDGEKFIQYPKDVKLPDGYYIKWPFSPPSRKNNHTYINALTGERKVFTTGTDNIPNQFIRVTEFNRIQNTLMGLNRIKFITDGLSNKKILSIDDPPAGWYVGKTNNYSQTKWHKRNKNGTTTGRMCINDGTRNKFVPRNEPIPEGWVKGLIR